MENSTDTTPKVRVVKKDDPKQLLEKMILCRDLMASDIADIKRRVNGTLIPLQAKMEAWDKMIADLQRTLKGH